MARGSYVGVSGGIKANNSTDYISLEHILDPNKLTNIEVVCKFTDTTTYSTVMRKS